MLFVHAINTILCRKHESSEADYSNIKDKINSLLYCSGTSYPRLYPNELNRDYYLNIISNYYNNEDLITNNTQKNTANEGLEIVFYTIYHTIEKYYSNAGSTIAFLQAFLDKFTTDLEFSLIDVLTANNSPRIFETLNFRGKDLVACEIIKNRVLLNVLNDPQERIYIDKWINISRKLKTSKSFDDYIRYTYLASMYHKRGNKSYETGGSKNDKEIFDHSIERTAFPGTEVTYPSVDELLTFMADKELVFITNYIEHHNMEIVKSKHFLNDYLLMRENYDEQYFRHDDYHDIRLFMTKVEDDGANSEHGLYPEDIRRFDVKDKIINRLSKISKESFCDKSDYYFEYESQSQDIQAVYFVTRYHSNPAWDANPVNLFNMRMCAFVLPGTISSKKAKKMPLKKKTVKTDCGSEYVIDSIHLNSNICFDMAEFNDLINGLFYEVFLD